MTQKRLESVEFTHKECTFLEEQPVIPDEEFQSRWTKNEKQQVVILKRKYEKHCKKDEESGD